MHTVDLDEQLVLMEKYHITSDELLFLTILLLLQDNEDYTCISHYLSLPTDCRNGIRETLLSLQEKEVITKAYKVPNVGQKFVPEDVTLNKNFVKNFYRCSFDMGKELFENYPMFGLINGEPVGIRSVSKKFDSLEDFYRYYGKSISWKPDKHEYIMELVSWAKDHNLLVTTLANFVIDHKWEELEALRNGEIANIDFNAVKQL